jgi:uncharacterized protein
VKTDKLEAMSLEELYALADRTGLDLPPGLERPFVIEEIVDALEDESEDRRSSRGEALHIDEKKYSELRIDEIAVAAEDDGSIPLRYNETAVHAIVRDPSWAFAYWDVADQEIAELRGEESSAGLFLRVAELGSPAEGSRMPADAAPDASRGYFDIPVSDDDLQWYINLPRSGVRFRIDLCTRQGGKLRVLARSNEVVSPRQHLATEDAGRGRRELLALSGIDEMAIEAGA